MIPEARTEWTYLGIRVVPVPEHGDQVRSHNWEVHLPPEEPGQKPKHVQDKVQARRLIEKTFEIIKCKRKDCGAVGIL